MIDTRFDTSIDLRGEIENYRQVALIKYYKMLLEIDPKKDRLTLLAVLRCIDKLERHSQERKRPRCDRKKMQADGTLAWHYQKRNQLFRKAGLYDIESTQYLVDHEEIFDTPEEREERERFEACRREALRKQEERKNEENEKAASETASPPENREEKESDSYERKPGDTPESLENEFGNREEKCEEEAHCKNPQHNKRGFGKGGGIVGHASAAVYHAQKRDQHSRDHGSTQIGDGGNRTRCRARSLRRYGFQRTGVGHTAKDGNADTGNHGGQEEDPKRHICRGQN